MNPHFYNFDDIVTDIDAASVIFGIELDLGMVSIKLSMRLLLFILFLLPNISNTLVIGDGRIGVSNVILKI